MKPATTKWRALKIVKKIPAPLPQVQVRLQRQQNRATSWLKVEFKVRNAPIHGFRKNQKSSFWGLWERDVCEVFISTATAEETVLTAPYYEFQVSPYGQYFEMKIYEPRKKTDVQIQTEIKYTARIATPSSWQASLKIPLHKIGLHKTKNIYGGAFSCLLKKPHRAYLGLFLPSQKKPDFHLPQYFCALL